MSPLMISTLPDVCVINSEAIKNVFDLLKRGFYDIVLLQHYLSVLK